MLVDVLKQSPSLSSTPLHLHQQPTLTNLNFLSTVYFPQPIKPPHIHITPIFPRIPSHTTPGMSFLFVDLHADRWPIRHNSPCHKITVENFYALGKYQDLTSWNAPIDEGCNPQSTSWSSVVCIRRKEIICRRKTEGERNSAGYPGRKC